MTMLRTIEFWIGFILGCPIFFIAKRLISRKRGLGLPNRAHSQLEIASTLYEKLPTDLVLCVLKYEEKEQSKTCKISCEDHGPFRSYGTFVCPGCQLVLNFYYKEWLWCRALSTTQLPDIVRHHLDLHPNINIAVYNGMGDLIQSHRMFKE